MKTFTLNGITYPAKEFDFNMVCDLEDMGLSLDDFGKKPLALMRSYVAICLGRGKDFAGKQIEEHIIGGGAFDSIMEVMGEMLEESDFFRKLQANTEEEVATTPKKRTTKKTIE